MTLSEELKWRGLVNQTTYKDLTSLDKEPITFYWGVDPSADSLTIGNLAAAMMVRRFVQHGHKLVLLIGGATGMVGDPDGKAEERQLQDRQTIEHNKEAIVSQYKTIFHGYDFDLVDNYDWFKDLNYLDFLRDVGKHVPMRQMLSREFVQSRLSDSGAGISYAEFSYVLIQAYDFLYLHEHKGVTLQVAGADQWGNAIAGVDLIRRTTGQVADVYSTPLVIDDTTGRKFGKSEAGAIWLDSKKTSPTQFYQFWVNLSDDSVEQHLKTYTDLDQPEIDDLVRRHQDNPGARLGQTELARQVTQLVHGEEATQVAQAVTDILTGKTDIDAANDQVIASLRSEIPTVKASDQAEIAQVLVDAGLASSKTEARKLISGRAISVNGEKSQNDNLSLGDFHSGRLLIRRGKAYRDTALVELQS